MVDRMDTITWVPPIALLAMLLIILGVVVRRVTSGAADALTVVPRARALFTEAMSPAGDISAIDLVALSTQVERDLRAVDGQIADRALRRCFGSVLHDVEAVSMDAPGVLAPTAMGRLDRVSGSAGVARAELLRDEADRGLRAVRDLEARAAFLVRLGTVVGR